MTFLMNAWYAAGWGSELEKGAILSRRLLDEPIVLFRTTNGSVKALHGLCPHRMVSLGRGKLVGEAIQCGYHGLTFDASGVCVHNPQGTPPKTMRVRPYPVVERHSLIWIWMGPAIRADPALIPDLGFQDPEDAYIGKGYLNVRASYELEIENILDLSHIEFLHATTLGSGQVSQGSYSWQQDGETIWSKRDIFGEVMTDELATNMGLVPGEKADRWLHVRWSAPANLVLYSGAVAHGRPREEGTVNPSAHLFTPETKERTHYWFSTRILKTIGPEGEAMAQAKADWLKVPFANEDVVMLEDQQKNIGNRDLRSLTLGWLPGDAAGARARKILYDKLDSEAGEALTNGLR